MRSKFIVKMRQQWGGQSSSRWSAASVAFWLCACVSLLFLVVLEAGVTDCDLSIGHCMSGMRFSGASSALSHLKKFDVQPVLETEILACRIAASNNCAVAVSTGGIQLDTLEGLRAEAEAEADAPSASAAVGEGAMVTGAGDAGGFEEGGGEMMHVEQSDAVMSGANRVHVRCSSFVVKLLVSGWKKQACLLPVRWETIAGRCFCVQ